MPRKIIISLAPVRSGDAIDKAALAEDVARCAELGAGMCHLHCRRPDGALTPDTTDFIATFEEILKRSDIVVQASTGGISEMTISERCRPLDYPRVESASLNGGSTNLNGGLYVNLDSDIDYCAKACYERGIIPEVEVFDIGMIYNVERSAARTPYRRPIFYNLVFGHKGGMQADMTCLQAFRSAVPAEAKWGVTHYGRDNWEFLAAAMAMGASIVRIGFEDSAYLAPGTDARFNYQVVERLVQLIQAMGLETATPDETRRIMGIVPAK
ncbi:MAG: 3-keto-5-aminohexanoate cleavage protein [Firmicutes bacterium]|nr:3-keto-5-aminohexanoate cleavage protein [Bacillota bacterium]